MSERRLLTGNAAAAWGARLADVDYVPAFPITPQTEIIETIARWCDAGSFPGRMTMLESEHSMVTAAGAAAATGARVFTATSSQGLLYAMEMLFTVAGWRAPFLLVNVSRGLSAPITLEPDHNDVLAARDSGFLQIHCSTCQEVLDSILIGYRVAEDARVRLPVIVNLDGFYLSFTREPVVVPEADEVAAFLPPFEAKGIAFRASAPTSQATAVLGGGPYSYFRYETHLAVRNGLAAYEEAGTSFAERFGRSWPVIEVHAVDDADIVIVMIGSFATKGREAVDRMRALGERVGLVRVRLLRPFPEEALRAALCGKRAVVVLDQNLSLGKGGILHSEIVSALYGVAGAPPVLASYIGGLGGRDITVGEFFEMVRETREAADRGVMPAARLLYREEELREMRNLQAVARVERDEVMS